MTDSRLRHDMLIVGGGPAGSTCARFAAMHGLDVAVIERTGASPPTRTSAGIFDHTWRALALSPSDYPHPMRSPNAAEFRTLNDSKELPTVLNTVVNKFNRHVYFPNRDEFDRWLLHLAEDTGAVVARDVAVRQRHIEYNGQLYHVKVGNNVHAAPVLVGAAGTACPVYRRFFDDGGKWSGQTMFLTELEIPESEYRGSPYVSYFNFMNSGVFGWTYIVGDGWLHIGTAHMSSQPKIKKRDLLFDKFLDAVKTAGQLDSRFDPGKHRASGGSIRMFAKRPMVANGGSCFVIGDSAGVLQCDAYNGISNAVLSGRLCAEAVVRGDKKPMIRERLNRYLFVDVLRDMLGAWPPVHFGGGGDSLFPADSAGREVDGRWTITALDHMESCQETGATRMVAQGAGG